MNRNAILAIDNSSYIIIISCITKNTTYVYILCYYYYTPVRPLKEYAIHNNQTREKITIAQ